MESLNYNNVAQNETQIDLSGMNLNLRELPNYLQGVRTSQINSLNVSGNDFHLFDSYRYGMASGGTSLLHFVEKFNNLTTLDMSSTISKTLVAVSRQLGGNINLFIIYVQIIPHILINGQYGAI